MIDKQPKRKQFDDTVRLLELRDACERAIRLSERRSRADLNGHELFSLAMTQIVQQ